MIVSPLFVLLISCSFFLSAFADVYDCLYEVDGSGTYDFSSLMNNNQDYVISTANAKFYLNMCRSTIVQNCGSNSAICDEWNGDQASLGDVSTYDFYGEANEPITLSFYYGTGDRSSNINFVCNSSVSIGYPVFLSEDPKLNFNFEWQTRVACSSSCNPLGSCSSCTAGYCQWCLDSNSCSSTNYTCSNRVTEPEQCPGYVDCYKFNSCSVCVTKDNPCSWCLDNDYCIQKGDNCEAEINNPKYCSTNSF